MNMLKSKKGQNANPRMTVFLLLLIYLGLCGVFIAGLTSVNILVCRSADGTDGCKLYDAEDSRLADITENTGFIDFISLAVVSLSNIPIIVNIIFFIIPSLAMLIIGLSMIIPFINPGG